VLVITVNDTSVVANWKQFWYFNVIG